MDHEESDNRSSELGTKEFWDDRYQLELTNFHDHGDEGEVWFGHAAESRLVKFITGLNLPKLTTRIVDVGAGNGSLLRRLRQLNFSNLTGLDYSPAAVQLAQEISSKDQSESEDPIAIRFQICDLLNDQFDPDLEGKFDLVLDKGTWDAISLAGDERSERLAKYRQTVINLFDRSEKGANAQDRYFIIDSCNFTRDDLISQLASRQLIFHCEIPAVNSFTFAGRSGSTSTAIVFLFRQCDLIVG